MATFGFTGPRDLELTERQVKAVSVLFRKGDVLHFGLCSGREDHAAKIAQELGCYLIAHPSTLLMWWGTVIPDEALPPKPPLERNQDTVNACDVLIAAPRSLVEEQRSGTWATIRYARRIGKPIIFLEP